MLVASPTMFPGSGPGYGPGWALTLSGVTEGIHGRMGAVVLVGPVVEAVPVVGVGRVVGVSGVGRSVSQPAPTIPATTARTTRTAVMPASRRRRRRPRLITTAALGIWPSLAAASAASSSR